MDINTATMTLHPSAESMLFLHYRTIRSIFNRVLGLIEVDYLSITLLTPQNELIFFSSYPSIEQNIIEQNLWQTDPSYQAHFFYQNRAQSWDELYPKETFNQLRQYKQDIPAFSTGLSIPTQYNQYRVTYCFALKSKHTLIQQAFQKNIKNLTSLGQFCLQNIVNTIPLAGVLKDYSKPYLTLVINNEEKP